LDGYFSLSRSGQEAACERFPQLGSIPGFVVPHGHYRDAYPNRIGKSQARSELGIPPTARVFTFVGQVRPYKNVPLLIHSFRELQDSHALLLVVGRIRGEQLEQEVTKAAEGDPRVRLKLSYIPDDELQLYLNAADLVVLPFEEILNSGSALLALSFDRPIFVPYKGALVELRDIVGSEWVKTFEGEPTAKSLSDAMEWALHTPRGKMAPLERFDWNHIAVQTLHGYRMIIAGNEAPGQERQSSPVARENA
jgi:glycosyltransferase involved in cell wall biosynthesis